MQDASPSFSPTGVCTSGANPFVQNTYDISAPGANWSGTDNPKGRLTQTIATNYFPTPDNTQGNVTEQMQYDARGRVITENLQVSASGGTLTFPTLPKYQLALTYNDANQVKTAQTTSTPSGVGYTTTRVYESTTGVLTGLSSNSTATPNVATLTYTPQALPGTLTFLANSTTSIASESLSYDGDLRPSGTTATWQSGSGSSGNFFLQTLSYDPAGNVNSLATTQAAVPGTNNSGGSETQNFCYDEQNRLVWAGNSGTQPGAGNGTCGSGTLSNSLAGANYNTSFVSTHLGQLWQGPLNGGSTQEQYLYCSSSQPHQLTGLYATGATCASKSGQVYAGSYDAFGNMTSRTYSGTTATLSYDILDHFTQWYVSSSNQE